MAASSVLQTASQYVSNPQRQHGAQVWQAAPRPSTDRPAQSVHRPSPERRLTIRTHAASSSAAAGLATYSFSPRRTGAAAEWFQAAVRDIVKQVDSQAPFLQTVQLEEGGAPPRLRTYGVAESVVAAPELWQGIAEHVSESDPDVVILVQRVSPHAADSPQGAMDAATAGRQQQQHGAAAGADVAVSSSSSGSGSSSRASPPGSPRAPRSPRVAAEEACRRLVSTGLADSILHGKVGDCCDAAGHGHTHSEAGGAEAADQRQTAAAGRALPLSAIVPFSPAGSSAATPARRTSVRTAALRPPGTPSPSASECQQSACYWGVVVQSRRGTGAEGCYLLKTVKNVSSTGCSCTHFSLTRISAGEHLESQFVQSWLL